MKFLCVPMLRKFCTIGTTVQFRFTMYPKGSLSMGTRTRPTGIQVNTSHFSCCGLLVRYHAQGFSSAFASSRFYRAKVFQPPHLNISPLHYSLIQLQYVISFDNHSSRFSICRICKMEMSGATQPSIPRFVPVEDPRTTSTAISNGTRIDSRICLYIFI